MFSLGMQFGFGFMFAVVMYICAEGTAALIELLNLPKLTWDD